MTNAVYTGARIYDSTNGVNPDIVWALFKLTESSTEYKQYKRYKDYIDGKHDRVFDTAEHEAAFVAFLQGLGCNICPSVVTALTDRLSIERLDGDEAAAARAWELWEDLNLAAVANRIHTEMVGAADAYLLVWPDEDGVPRLYPHTALEMCHEHDHEKPEVITKAAKLWKEDKRWRLTLYYADRIEKYRTRTDNTSNLTAAAFEPYEIDGEAWPLDNPYGTVPVFHFPYDADTHRHGRSAIHHVIPLQNNINQSMVGRAIVLYALAYPLRILAGVEEDIETDPTKPNFGRAKDPIRAYMDRLLTFPNPDTKALEFDAASPEPYESAISSDLNKITVITGIPPHHFQITNGDFPSGESLKTSESRLVHRVEDAQLDLTSDWARVFAFMLQIVGIENAKVRPVWANANTRSERDEAEIMEMKQRGGVPWRQRMKDYGYDDETIAEMEQEPERQGQKVEVERSRAALARDRGADLDLEARIAGDA